MDNLGSWIPQIFYDLIGRVAPGILLLGVALVIFLPISQIQDFFTNNNIPTFVINIGFLVIAYLVGSLLGGVAAAGAAILRRDFDFWRRVDLSDLTTKKEVDISYVYDFIQYRHSGIGARLAKISAERHMCRVIIAGSIILLLIYLFVNPRAYLHYQFWIVVAMTFAATSLGKYLDGRSKELMRNNWQLLQNNTPLVVQDESNEKEK